MMNQMQKKTFKKLKLSKTDKKCKKCVKIMISWWKTKNRKQN